MAKKINVVVVVLICMFVGNLFALHGAKTYHADSSTRTLWGPNAFQWALDTAYFYAGTGASVSKIEIWGNPSPAFVASGDYFVIDDDLDFLTIEYNNAPGLADGVYISGSYIRFRPIYWDPSQGHLYIDTADPFAFYIAEGANRVDLGYFDATAADDGVVSFGNNVLIHNAYIYNCADNGIRNNGLWMSVDTVGINSCEVGIRSMSTLTAGDCVTKAIKVLINACDYGFHATNNAFNEIKRTTVANFTEIGVYNGSAATYVDCIRVLCYSEDLDDVDDCCFYQVEFLNAWSGSNDNVAMGSDCNTDRLDFYSCLNVGVNAISNDNICTSFIEATADIYNVRYRIGSVLYDAMSYDYGEKLLCNYFESGVYVFSSDVVGYDQDTTFGNIAKKNTIESEEISTPEDMVITAYPNPFNSSVSFDSYLGTVEIYDLSGRKVAESETGKWIPERHIESGVYLAVVNDGTKSISERIVYLK